jgi:hypothetical protein
VGAVAQQLDELVNNFVFLPKPNYRIVTDGGVTPSPLGLLKSTSTIEFQQVTPPSSTHIRTPDSVIAPANLLDRNWSGYELGNTGASSRSL